MAAAGALTVPRRSEGRPADRRARDPVPRRHLHLPHRQPPGARPLRPDHPRRARPWRSSGQNGAGKTTVAKLLCRLYDPDSGSIEVDGVDLRDLDLAAWRRALAAVFQDFVRYELPLRDNVAPLGGDDRDRRGGARAGRCTRARRPRRADGEGLPRRRRPVRRPVAAGRPGPGDRRRSARAQTSYSSTSRRRCSTCAARPRSSAACSARRRRRPRSWSPTASPRCARPTLICVVEHGRAIELGSHEELMALGGRYHTMYDLQASRFVEVDEHGEEVVHESL